ncbi:hypothetical protein PRIC2_012494 [Phytophthora ramorum]
MFLELSFNSQAGDKEASASKAASSWRYDREDKQEMSLDELISDFQQSATSRRSKPNESVSGSDVSPLRMASPPRRAKAKESDKRSFGFVDRARVVKREPSQKKAVRGATRNVQHDDSSDDDGGAVMPMPRLEHILKNKPSFALKRRTPAVSTASTRSKLAAVQRSKPRARPPVLSPPSLSPQSLSPLTSSSLASSPLSVSEDMYTPETPDEDSIDALIGKDIRELNKLVSTGSRQTGAIGAARSPTTDEISSVLRQSTRFRQAESTKSRLPLQLKLSSGKARSAMPESPPPPPPPEDEDEDFEDEEEDSFAQEIRQLRDSRRVPTKAPEKETPQEETELESSAVCATAALKVRNASNAINELLLAALKPFEDRQREEEKTKALEEEDAPGDAVIRNAATAELQSATQTIVSQLDLTFADMTERRKADLKAEVDAAAATKVAEKTEKEAVEAKKKADEKEAKEREMEILRLIPMQGKLLTCSADIENVLTQLERTDTEVQRQPVDGASAMEAEIAALRRHTQRKIHEIEAQMAAAPSSNGKSDRFDGVSWRAVDWVQGNNNLDVDQSDPHDRGNNQLSATNESGETDTEATDDEGAYQQILQRQVLEKLDLTMLKLKHVLSIDTKEAAEAQEKQQREIEEQKTKQAQQQLEVERKEREEEDADNARRRVMGVTSVNEVEGWIEEGRQLQDELGHDRSLNRLIASLDDNMNAENARSPCWRAVPPNQEEALRHFDRLATAMTAQQQPQLVNEEAIHEHRDWNPDDGRGKSYREAPVAVKSRVSV